MFYIQPLFKNTIDVQIIQNIETIGLSNPKYRIYMVLKGEILVKREGHNFQYEEFDLFFLSPEETLSYKIDSEVTFIQFSFQSDFLQHALPKIDLLFERSWTIDKSELYPLRPNLAHITKLFLSSAEREPYRYAMYVYGLLASLSSLLPTEDLDVHQSSNDLRKEDRIRQIESYIRQNYHRSLSMTELADQLYLTPQYLSKFIKEQLGNTFVNYLNSVRLEHAVNELLQTEHTITQIAYNNGYPNLTAFNKSFRDQYHTTPLKYRSENSKASKTIEEKSLMAPISKETQYVAHTQLDKVLLRYENASALASTSIANAVYADAGELAPYRTRSFELINLGFAVNLLSHSFQAQLSDMQSDLHFKYARFQGIAEPEIIDKIPNTDRYNFSNANRIFDFLLSVHLIPFIEIGPKPRKFNANYQNYVYLSGSSPVFRSIEEQLHFIHHFIHHCVNRYGHAEVEKWYFELWLPHGMHLEYDAEEIQVFIKNYQNLYVTVKNLLPNAQVGGFGFNLARKIETFTNIYDQFRRAELVFDFISLTTFHVEISDHPESNFPYLTTDEAFLRSKLSDLEKTFNSPSPPLIIAEWNFDFTARNHLNDSVFKALFITKNLLEMTDSCKMIAYWLFSDLSSEFKDTTKMLFGGNGLVTIDGLKKPAYFAYQFISQLGHKLIKKGDGYIITTLSPNTYAILLYNYEHPSDFFCFRYDTEIHSDNVNDIFDETPPKQVHIELSNIAEGNYRIKTYTLDKDHGSILDEWNKMGAIVNVTSTEIAYFNNITVPNQTIYYQKAQESLHIHSTLARNEIHFIQIQLEL